MKMKFLHILLFLGLLADAVYSFQQFYHTSLDGDVAESVLPTPIMEPLFKDPFGLGLFKDPTPYHNPNRFFSHYSYYLFFNYVPSCLQHLVSPINSIYATAAVFKLLTQLLLIFIISYYIQRGSKKKGFWLLYAAIIITPFFQSFGYRSNIGVIDPAITYVFFYAFPVCLILIYYLPVLHGFSLPRKLYLKSIFWIVWMILACVISLSGPLNPGVVLIINLLLVIQLIFIKGANITWKARLQNIPINMYAFIIPISCLSLYSLYIGSFNAYTLSSQIPIAELYAKIPMGLFTIFTQKLAWPLIFCLLVVNYYLLSRDKSLTARGIKHEYYWVAAFACLYILLLPLGGFRSYRPLVIRYDTILPVTLASIYLIGRSTIFLQAHLIGSLRKIQLLVVLLILSVFVLADRDESQHNSCEKTGLQALAQAKDSPQMVNSDCTIMSWDPIHDPKNSIYNARLFEKWQITDTLILYYQR
jgi:hypothetical protein